MPVTTTSPIQMPEYLDPRIDKASKKAYKKCLPAAKEDNPKRWPPCVVCATPSKQRCSGCKAITVCSKACLKSIWKTHKPECKNVSDARKRHEKAVAASETPASHFRKGIPFSADVNTLISFNNTTVAVWKKHGVTGAPPDANTSMSTQALVMFFSDMLEACDAGSPANKDVELSLRLFMNRRYNNTYTHLINNFGSHPGHIVDRVHMQCTERKIGDFGRE